MGMDDYPEWFLKKPYRPAPAPGPGESNRDILHLSVGYIAHHWEMLEGELYYLYTTMLLKAHPRGGNLGALSATYSSIVSASARRDAIEATVAILYGPGTTARARLFPLLKLVSRGIGRRNDAVHGIVAKYNDIGLFIMPPNYTPMPMWDMAAEGSSSFKYRYTAAHLAEISQVILLLQKQLAAAVNDLKADLIGPFLGTLPPPAGPKGTQ